jgi:sugar O-acyltransferase (sialic acid O-acetyltransferase NeuD family)
MTITGAGAFAREVFFLAESLGHHVKGFITSDVLDLGKPVLHTGRCIISQTDLPTVIAVGNPKTRMQLTLPGQEYIKLIAESAINHDPQNRIEEGSIICDVCILTTNIRIGSHVILNLGCLIGHDVKIGDYCTLSPGVKVMGNCQIGEGCEIGTGAILVPMVELPPNGIIGAGAVVTKTPEINQDIPYTMVGVPAKVIKNE